MTEQCGPESAVGGRLRQPTVCDPNGKTCRVDEIFGPSFTVIGRTEGDLKMGPEARGILDRLGGRAISLEGLEVVEGTMDSVFQSHPAVVLRPDRYLFGVVDDDWDLDALLRELGERVALA